MKPISGSYDVQSEVLCVQSEDAIDEITFTVGYPKSESDEFTVELGKTYTFSFQARGTAEVAAKVGLAVDPFTAIGSTVFDVDSGFLRDFSFDVVPTETVDRTGVALDVILQPLGSVCFDNIVLQEKEE